MTPALETIELETAAAPDAAVIWLHGLGADGHDFEPVVPELRLPGAARLRFVFPHAPVRPVTLNMGMPMRAWYDIYQLGGSREDGEGIRASQAQVERLIARERARGVAAQRIVLAGFSQGGAIALHTGLRHGERLAGVLALSTYLPLADTLAAERSDANGALPVFMAHGGYDDIIPVERARQSYAQLEALGYPVAWKEYAMPHAVCAPEIADIAAWLLTRLAPSP
ncbi:MAG TPA: alpha/beta fold hydrolase [Burkholderiales bacterium]|nr:alpha/beta fold hydrolase [Burkholderiales bacterium]